MAARTKKTESFEDGLNRLEEMAQEMETSQLPLEELLKRYEEGMKLAGDLTGKLAAMKAALETVQPEGAEKPENSQLSLTDLMGGAEE
jgi:exodeoxyribonuclease VII small subunit